MEFEYWWLLGFPLFFGLGWVAARIDSRHLVRESRALPRSYFKGLNFLLMEQPDKEIEAFIEVVKVDGPQVELHFALGSLLRRRGEHTPAASARCAATPAIPSACTSPCFMGSPSSPSKKRWR